MAIQTADKNNFKDLINTTENPEIAEEYGITAVPTIHFYKDGQLVDSHVGVMQPQAVKDVIAQYMYT